MIHELRIYETAPGGLTSLNNSFANVTMNLFTKHGIQSFGYWTEDIGTNNRLVYIVEFENMAQRADSWASFRSDPDWQSHLKKQVEENRPGVQKVYNTILIPTTYSPKQPKGGDGWVYELRQYDTEPGHVPALNDRFANVTMRLFEKHGIKNIGYWTEDVGVSNRLDYIVAYENMAARETSRKGFLEDPEWQEATKKSLDAGRPIVRTIHNTVLKPTSYSPLQ